jgi:putative DNA primase/helicase
MNLSVRATALAAQASGLCVVPPKEDGSKRPDVTSWKRYQQDRPTAAEIRRWDGDGETNCSRRGVGLVCGAVSGGLELLEFDDYATYVDYKQTADDLGLTDLIERIERGYCEKTPSGGIHWLYFCTSVEGNTRLASEPTLSDDRVHSHRGEAPNP